MKFSLELALNFGIINCSSESIDSKRILYCVSCMVVIEIKIC